MTPEAGVCVVALQLYLRFGKEQKKAEQASKELIADQSLKCFNQLVAGWDRWQLSHAQETLKLLEKTSCHRNKSMETVFKVKQDQAFIPAIRCDGGITVEDTSRANHRSEDCLSRPPLQRSFRDISRIMNFAPESTLRRTAELAEMKKQLEKHALDVEADRLVECATHVSR